MRFAPAALHDYAARPRVAATLAQRCHAICRYSHAARRDGRHTLQNVCHWYLLLRLPARWRFLAARTFSSGGFARLYLPQVLGSEVYRGTRRMKGVVIAAVGSIRSSNFNSTIVYAVACSYGAVLPADALVYINQHMNTRQCHVATRLVAARSRFTPVPHGRSSASHVGTDARVVRSVMLPYEENTGVYSTYASSRDGTCQTRDTVEFLFTARSRHCISVGVVLCSWLFHPRRRVGV